MTTIENVTIEDFKLRFKTLPYLPIYVENKAYFTDDIVYYELNFYKSLTDGNLTLPTDTTNWELTNDTTDNYITDEDIEEAFNEAKINFNPNLFPNDDVAKIPFLYLAGHYLMIDVNIALNPLGTGAIGFTTSKSVGSVSEGFSVPQWMLNNQWLSPFAQTPYGRKYLTLIKPYLIGNIIYTNGSTVF